MAIFSSGECCAASVRMSLPSFSISRPSLRASHAGFQRDAVGAGAGRVAPGVTQGTATELQHGIVAEDADQRGHVPDVDTTGGHGEQRQAWNPSPDRRRYRGAVFRHEGFTQQIDPAEGGCAIAFQLADDGTGVQVVTTGQAQDLGQHAEVDAVVRVAVDHGVHGAVDVQQHAVVATPFARPVLAQKPPVM